MPQYGVLVYMPTPADPMALSTEFLKEIERYPEQAVAHGGKVLGGSYFAGDRGFAFTPTTAAVAVSGEERTTGTLIDSELVPSAFFVLSAPDMETAVRIASLHPATLEGGVEVRPMLVAPAG